MKIVFIAESDSDLLLIKQSLEIIKKKKYKMVEEKKVRFDFKDARQSTNKGRVRNKRIKSGTKRNVPPNKCHN